MSRDVRRVDNYCNSKEIKDNRNFLFGCIWKVRDILINIPNADRLNKRKYHFTRCVVIIDNSKENMDEENPLISVAPISHRSPFIC